MILIENATITGLEETIRGMRNPMNSWDKSDSGICRAGDSGIGCSNCAAYDCEHTFDQTFQIGKADHELMMKLAKAGSVHGKFRRMMAVYVDITAPLYWWKEFDTYKVGTVANSCSTMHKIHAKEFELSDFSTDHLTIASLAMLEYHVIEALEANRKIFLALDGEAAKQAWWQMIQLLPSSYNQRRTVMMNYEVLAGIYQYRRDHKLDEWREFCRWIEELPHGEIITCKEIKNDH